MALSDEVVSRFPSTNPRLKQLTNPGVQAASSVNTAVLDLASTDVEADFQTYAGVAYDNTEARHVSVGVWGVIAKLAMQGEAAGSTAIALDERWVEKLEALGKVTGRNRVKMSTKSTLTPTPEQQDAETVRPPFDWPIFDDILLDPPK